MSLILEALRKSEAERRRGLAPDVAMELPPTQTARPRPIASWLLPALVVAALLVLAGWWSRREPPVDMTPTASTLPASTVEQLADPAPSEVNAAPAVVPRPRPEPAKRSIVASPTPLPPPAIVHAERTSAVPAASIPPPRPMPVDPAPSRPLLPPPPAASEISNDTSALPPIKLSMHIWNEVPSKRFVILNGQRMAEGDQYGAITVVAIERNGVVVESNGSRARVPLP